MYNNVIKVYVLRHFHSPPCLCCPLKVSLPASMLCRSIIQILKNIATNTVIWITMKYLNLFC